MKKLFKIIVYGIVGAICLMIAVIILILPSVLADVTGNMNYLWFYIPHVIGLTWLLGYVIYTSMED